MCAASSPRRVTIVPRHPHKGNINHIERPDIYICKYSRWPTVTKYVVYSSDKGAMFVLSRWVTLEVSTFDLF